MADDVYYDSAGERTKLAHDEVGGVKFPRSLLVWGPDGGPLTQVDVGAPLPVAMDFRSSEPKGYEAVAVTTGAAIGLTIPDGTLEAVIVPAVDVRWRDDGLLPTHTTGMVTLAGAELHYDANLLALKFIAISTDGTLDIAYYG